MTVNLDVIYLGIGMLVVLVVVVILLWKVVVPRMVQQRQVAIREGRSSVQDRAWNQIQAGRGLADFLEREGLDVREARSSLEQALGKYEMRRFGEAQRMAKEASDGLAEKRKKAKSVEVHDAPVPVAKKLEEPEPEPPVYRDLAHRVGDPEPDPPQPRRTPGSKAEAPLTGERTTPRAAAQGEEDGMEKEGDSPAPGDPEETDEGSLYLERSKRPKDFMESRFMLASLQDDLRAVPADRQSSPEVREARDWAGKSQGAFDRRDYTESLRLAMRGRRRLGGTSISTITVGAGTVVETPPEELSPTAQRSSAPPHAASAGPSRGEAGPSPPEPPKVSCGRCGRVNNTGDRFCRGCGAPLAQPKCPRCQKPVEPDDRFCHGCGAPLGG